ncbi:MAG: translation initiation factor IF-2 N-terminal domain-containing protein, partial [Acidobacteriota bacterium]
MSKVRIYDLAKELKLESKKVLEDARRMGVDVSVPSNTLEDPIAARIREMYYPKKKEVVAAKPTARLIKHHPTAAAPALEKTPEATESTPTPTPVVAEVTPQKTAEVASPTAQATVIKPLARPVPVAAKPQPAPIPESKIELHPVETQAKPDQPEVDPNKSRLVKLPSPAKAPLEILQPAEFEEEVSHENVQAEPVTAPEIIPVIVDETPASAPEAIEVAEPALPIEAKPIVKPNAQPATVRPTTHKSQSKPGAPPLNQGTKVIRLAMPTGPLPKPSPTTSARFQTDKPKPTGKLDPSMLLKKDQPRDGKEREAHILPSGAQQRTVYIPPKDQKPKGRNQHRAKDKEKDKFQDGNTHRLGLRKQALPVAAQRMAPVDLKPVRLIEGSTVREFAEKLDAKPRDVVAALMQRGVMATINQIMNHDLAIEIGRDYGFEVTFGDFEDMIVESEFEITPEAMD